MPGLERRVDRPVLPEPGAEQLLHAHRHQRPEPEQRHAVRLPGLPQHVEQRPLVLGRDPDLVAEVAAVRHPPDPGRDHADVDPPERHEREVGRGQRLGRHRLQHVAGVRTGDGQPDERQARAPRSRSRGRPGDGRGTSGSGAPRRPASRTGRTRRRRSRATENSPTMRPSGLSIAVSAIRPTLGRRFVNSPCSQSARRRRR